MILNETIVLNSTLSNYRLVTLSEEGIYNIQMTDCPAYVSNDREVKRANEYTYEEDDLAEPKSTKTL